MSVPKIRNRWVARVAVAGLAAGALALAGSGSALANGNTPGGKPATKVAPKAAPLSELPSGSSTIQRGKRWSFVSVTKDGKPDSHPTPIVEVTLKFGDKTSALAYCIDFEHDASTDGHQYDPGAWNSSNVPNLPKIQWILGNSYPHVSGDDLFKAAGVSTTGLGDANFLAFSATQTAIWHYSDKIELIGNAPKAAGTTTPFSAADYAAVNKVRQFLIEKAKDAPEPPAPGVAITPKQASGYAGGNAGPFTVTTTGAVDKLALTAGAGSTIVDENGKPLTDIKNGTKFWVHTTTTGTVSVTASGAGTIPSGEVYVSHGQVDKAQKLILADTATTQVSDTAQTVVTASPSPSPSSASPSASPSVSTAPASVSPSASGTAGGGLPVTGTSLPIIVGSALVLLVGGGAIIMLARRRRHTS